MTVKVEVTGINEANNFLKKKEKYIFNAITDGLGAAALHLHGEVKQSIAGRRNEPTSVDTGRFLNSVDYKVGKEDAVIFTNISYAKFLEYGTTRLSPRRHFNNSKDRNKVKLGEIMKSKINNI